MDNIREKVKNIRLLLNDNDLNINRDEFSLELDNLEAIVDYLEKKNSSLRNKIDVALKDVGRDLDTDLEEIGDILY